MKRIETARAARAAHAETIKAAAAARRDHVAAVEALKAATAHAVAEAVTAEEKAAARQAVEAARQAERETARALDRAAQAVETARAEYIAARAALLSVDFAELDGDEMSELCAAATEKAMQRRNAETAQDLPTMRRKYGEDARQETAARALEMLTPGGWIEGEYTTERDDDGNPTETAPRREMPLSLFAAHAAGRALDALIYADGGHNVKLTARERREHYGDRETAPEAVTETRRTVDPVAPSPEAAAIEAETLPRIVDRIPGEAMRATAARLLCLLYTGHTLTEAAEALQVSDRYMRRVMQAIANAAALVKVEDGETRDLERAIESDRRTLTNAERRAATAARAALGAREADAPEAAPAVTWTAGRPDRLSHTARHATADAETLCRLFYGNAATR